MNAVLRNFLNMKNRADIHSVERKYIATCPWGASGRYGRCGHPETPRYPCWALSARHMGIQAMQNPTMAGYINVHSFQSFKPLPKFVEHGSAVTGSKERGIPFAEAGRNRISGFFWYVCLEAWVWAFVVVATNWAKPKWGPGDLRANLDLTPNSIAIDVKWSRILTKGRDRQMLHSHLVDRYTIYLMRRTLEEVKLMLVMHVMTDDGIWLWLTSWSQAQHIWSHLHIFTRRFTHQLQGPQYLAWISPGNSV